MTEMQSSDGPIMTQISSADFSTISSADDNGSVTRLEVLVVDGNCWETTEFDQGNLNDLNQTHMIQTNGQILTPINVQFSNQHFETDIQHFWEPQQIPQVPLIKPSCSRLNQFSRFQENNNNEDQENGNLSWLLDFKLDSLIEAADDRSTFLSPKDNNQFSKESFFSIFFVVFFFFFS